MKEKKERILASEVKNYVDESVVLLGWVESIRDHGKVCFIDLRDRSGIVQCVLDGSKGLSVESVVRIEGKVLKRPDRLINPKLESGTVEISVESLDIFSKSQELPIPIDSDGLEIDEEKRLKFRYLDLRRSRMSKNIKLRGRVTQFIRNWLSQRDFVEIETPILTKTTPEGARDFIVPSRLKPGMFYALPQSPQQYKQMLMVSGFEKYFQIARCFRDEDPRMDRAYGEFTQLDLEVSFMSQDEILSLTEEMFSQMVKDIFPEKKITETPWPRLTHKEVMDKYKTDKPDLRQDKEDPDELAFAWVLEFPLFNKQTDDDYFHGSGKAKWAPSHHMFTAPNPDDIGFLDSDPGKVRGLQHDLVLNGFEVGGGSIRIHDPKIQEKVFDLIGFTKEQKKQFTHLLTAFKYGVPPHGGIAPGIDRLIMAILSEKSLREVIAFPMTAGGQTAVMDAPSTASESQLKELGIRVSANGKK